MKCHSQSATEASLDAICRICAAAYSNDNDTHMQCYMFPEHSDQRYTIYKYPTESVRVMAPISLLCFTSFVGTFSCT